MILLVILCLTTAVFIAFQHFVEFLVYLMGKRAFHRLIYLNSLHWKLVRKVKRRFSVYKCAKCNQREHLDLHHLTYEHYWWEYFHLKDLAWLCRKHHAEIHMGK